MVSRRQAIRLGLAAPLIPLTSGCRASLPPWSAANSRRDALALLHESATAHGLAAFAAINDINVSYAGRWRRLVGLLQPILVDSGFRGGSEERLLLRDGIVAQAHSGPKGHKQVVRIDPTNGVSTTRVWFNDEEARGRDTIGAAALVAQAYSLFLLGPLLLDVNQHPRRDVQASRAGTADIRQGGQPHVCDVLNLEVAPGFGNSASDRVAMYIDRENRLMRRVRMTLNGLESTQGALVDIDTFEHRSLHGVTWPTVFHERLLRPAPLDVHAWRLTGLDVDRGEMPAEVAGPAFTGTALAPAAPLSAAEPPEIGH